MSTNAFQRQHARFAVVELGIENMGSGNEITAKLPQGAVLIGAGLLVTTAFNSETTATGTISDGTTSFVNAQSVASTGNKTVANTPKNYDSGATITFSLAETGAAATEGAAVAWVEYLVRGNGDEVYG